MCVCHNRVCRRTAKIYSPNRQDILSEPLRYTLRTAKIYSPHLLVFTLRGPRWAHLCAIKAYCGIIMRGGGKSWGVANELEGQGSRANLKLLRQVRVFLFCEKLFRKCLFVRDACQSQRISSSFSSSCSPQTSPLFSLANDSIVPSSAHGFYGHVHDYGISAHASYPISLM